MARKGTTGESRVWFVPTIASGTLAPTVAELTAGTDLTPFLTRDGFDAPQSASLIDASDAANRRNKNIPGNIDAGTLTLTGYRDSVTADDDFFAALPQDTAGFIVERPFGGSSVAHAAAQKVNVFEVVVVSRSPQAWGDEARKVVVTCAVEGQAEDIAVLA
jgi:hypothetical protein